MPRPDQRGELYLGGIVDLDDPERGLLDYRPEGADQDHPRPLLYDRDRLTTHGVIVGMTGSGKTGLGVLLLEELLGEDVPALIVDPKGDMANLALTFPGLSSAEFAPWVVPEEAKRAGLEIPAYAAEQAALWKKGLNRWQLSGDDIAALRAAAAVEIFTPGSTAGIPLNVLGALEAPDLDPETHGEALADEAEAFVSGLLALAGVQADPVTSREHILLANLVLHAWGQGRALSLAELIAQIQRPPVRKLGVFDIDTFFPEKDRTALALRLNGLLASPSFAPWLRGEPLDVGRLLRRPEGGARGAVLSIAHLADAERQFFVALLMSKVATWMQTQSGSTDLRALVYMDEVAGFVPPSAAPPSKKPILKLLKQARAFGVGLVLTTQNPVDLDYKALSNAGTWMIGRLNTEQDRDRLLSGMSRSHHAELGEWIATLKKRQFVLRRGGDDPRVFGTRWAMSYLRGPLTRAEIRRLTPDRPTEAPPASAASGQAADAGAPASAPAAPHAASAAALADGAAAVMPPVASGAELRWLDRGAPWAADVGADPAGLRHEAMLAARVRVRFDERVAKLDHAEEYELLVPLQDGLDVAGRVQVDFDERDFDAEPRVGATYVTPEAPIGQASFFRSAEKEIRDAVTDDLRMTVFKNASLTLYSRPGESEADFRKRGLAAAEDEADAEAAALRDKIEDKARTLEARRRDAERKAERYDEEASSRRTESWLDSAGGVVGAFLGGRLSTSTVTRGLSRYSRGKRMTEGAESRAEAAWDKAEQYELEIRDLEEELTAELQRLHERAEARADDVEAIEVGLERDDVRVQDLWLVWVPRG